jgi:hypothetical protein
VSPALQPWSQGDKLSPPRSGESSNWSLMRPCKPPNTTFYLLLCFRAGCSIPSLDGDTMWIFTTIGFFSIVQKPRTDFLTVRARVASDLDDLRKKFMP